MATRSLEYVTLQDIVPATRNPKGHALDELAASIDRFGFMEPLLMDERTGRLVGGHGRLETLADAEAAGLAMPDGIALVGGRWAVPVTRGWASADDMEAQAALIALNRLVERGGWDNTDLSTMLAELRDGPGLDGVGYSAHDLDVLLAQLAPEEDETPGVASIQPPRNPKTKRGDVWLIGDHRVMCGDCRDVDDVATLLAGATVNVAFTSPPYAEQRTYDESSGFQPIPPAEYVAWFADVADNVSKYLADDGSWFVNIKPPADGLDTDLYVFDLVIAHVREWGWHFATEFCWERPGVPKQVSRRFKNAFEPIYHFARGEWKMRPEAVRTFSDNIPINAGPGAGDSNWSNDQGTGIIMGRKRRPRMAMPPQGSPDDWSGSGADVRRPHKGGRSGNMAKMQGNAHLTPREHGVPGVGGGETHQGQGTYAPGEYTYTGLAYPSNRLPTFSGTHEATGHTAAFPVGLPQWFVKAYTDPGDVVYDPFVGSGSTILAAHNEQRLGYGMELSPKYVDVICTRLQQATGITPILERTGRPRNFAS